MNIRKSCATCISFIEAVFRLVRHRLYNKQPRSVFLHSMFRSGSTYFFNKFRTDGNYWCFYEPLHHQLIEIKPDRLDIFPFDKKTTKMMSHPALAKPHFYEFKAVLYNGHIPFFNVFMSYDEFVSVRQHARMYKYIMTLLLRTPDNLIPMLQFNRSSLRIGWFRRFFKDSLHVFILRNPRDQFESYYRQGKKYNIFLGINLYIIASNAKCKQFQDAYRYFSGDYTPVHELYADLNQLANSVEQISPETHYRIFLHIWVCSLIEAQKHADLVIDIDQLTSSDAYKADIVSKIGESYPISPDIFADCTVTSYETYSVEDAIFKEIEEEVHDLYAPELKTIDVRF